MSLPVYVSGNFNLHPPRVKTALDWFRGMLPGAEFAYARELVARAGGIDAWSRRWPVERTRYGAMLLLTAALPEDDAMHSGQHVLEEPIVLELGAFLQMRRPIGWVALPTGFGEVRFTGRFVVESLERIDFLRFAVVAPAVDAQPFAPAVMLPVQAEPPHPRTVG
jgi:hypothetical protein